MSYYKNTTQVPNVILDRYLKQLSEKELKVLLVVVRQTIGWVNRHGLRKERDWISQRYFTNKTGLSGKSVSLAIDMLAQRNFIVPSTSGGKALKTRQSRRGQKRIYYQCSQELLNNIPLTSEEFS